MKKLRNQKPDRFERMVLAALKKQDTPESLSIWLNGPDVVALLRREHQAVVRLIRSMPYVPYLAIDLRQEVLAQLIRRAT